MERLSYRFQVLNSRKHTIYPTPPCFLALARLTPNRLGHPYRSHNHGFQHAKPSKPSKPKEQSSLAATRSDNHGFQHAKPSKPSKPQEHSGLAATSSCPSPAERWGPTCSWHSPCDLLDGEPGNHPKQLPGCWLWFPPANTTGYARRSPMTI